MQLHAALNEVIRSPREIGALCPSSERLGNTMASLVGDADEGLVVELGAGTGVITESLLRSGIAPGRLVIIEKSSSFASYLSERFPQISVFHADAGDWPSILGRSAVKTVVSGLATAFPCPIRFVHRITDTWARSLDLRWPRIRRFTYSLFGASAWQNAGLKRIDRETVWGNLPPARVEVFSRP